jgi:hypothetical protein
MKAIYNTVTGETHPLISRTDGHPIESLDPSLLVMNIDQEPQPPYDEATQVLEATESVDVEGLTITRGWNVAARIITVGEQVALRRAQMAATFDALPVEVQAAFYMTRISAEAAMDRGRFDIARALIDSQQVPPELAAAKSSVLSHFSSLP